MRLLKKANEVKCRCMKCSAVFLVKNKDWKKVVVDYPRIVYKNEEAMTNKMVTYQRFSVKCPICGDYVIISMERKTDD